MLRELYPLLVLFLIGIGAVAAAAYFLTIPTGNETPPSQHVLRFSLPVVCRFGKDCFVQNYVDVDPGPGIKDFACGGATYDGHKGTDFRVLSAAAGVGVAVVAAADGKVLRLRDSMPDRLMRDYASREELKAAVGDKECGNGVFIDHGGGWTSQYCHLRKGSIDVSPGQQVSAGARLGTVGSSGQADFAHVHFAIRHNEAIVDPFLGPSVDAGACNRDANADEGLWQPAVRDQLQYGRHVIFDAGFAGAPPHNDALERDHRVQRLRADSPALVFYARMINLKAGDRVAVAVVGPEGFRVGTTTKPLKKNKAVQFIYAGKKRKAARWPAGQYKAGVSVLRRPQEGEAAEVIAQKKMTFVLP